MRPHLRLVALALCSQLVLLATSSHAQDLLPGIFKMPLRADKVVTDATKQVAVIAGAIDWPDGRTTTDVEITCAKGQMTLAKGEISKGSGSIITWEADASFCTLLARRIQRRE